MRFSGFLVWFIIGLIGGIILVTTGAVKNKKYGKDSGLAAIGIGGLLIIINCVLIGIILYLMIGIETGSIRLM